MQIINCPFDNVLTVDIKELVSQLAKELVWVDPMNIPTNFNNIISEFYLEILNKIEWKVSMCELTSKELVVILVDVFKKIEGIVNYGLLGGYSNVTSNSLLNDEFKSSIDLDSLALEVINGLKK